MTDAALLEKFCDFYNTFSAAWLPRLEELYAPNFVFSDPLHTIEGDFGAMRDYFKRVLALPLSKFTTEDLATGADGSYVRWTWTYKLLKGSDVNTAPGVTHLRLVDGKIAFHRDLFDAASAVYEALPVLGSAIRLVKKRM